eukprot:GEMP01021846.1.p1 GENE.GEMP01021846.1~~GEMP01021846.1.p1  ORF type:complete len:492 (+),score=103.38 GEMP01021846.1:114-1589(+)
MNIHERSFSASFHFIDYVLSAFTPLTVDSLDAPLTVNAITSCVVDSIPSCCSQCGAESPSCASHCGAYGTPVGPQDVGRRSMIGGVPSHDAEHIVRRTAVSRWWRSNLCGLGTTGAEICSPRNYVRPKQLGIWQQVPFEVWQRVAWMLWGTEWSDFRALVVLCRDSWKALLGSRTGNVPIWHWICRRANIDVSTRPRLSPRRLCVLLAILQMLVRNALEFCDALALADIESVLKNVDTGDLEMLDILRSVMSQMPPAKLQAVRWLFDVATKHIISADTLHMQLPCGALQALEKTREWLRLNVDANVISWADVEEGYRLPRNFVYPTASLHLEEVVCLGALRLLTLIEVNQGTADFGFDEVRVVATVLMDAISDSRLGSPAQPMAVLLLLSKALWLFRDKPPRGLLCFWTASDMPTMMQELDFPHCEDSVKWIHSGRCDSPNHDQCNLHSVGQWAIGLPHGDGDILIGTFIEHSYDKGAQGVFYFFLNKKAT